MRSLSLRAETKRTKLAVSIEKLVAGICGYFQQEELCSHFLPPKKMLNHFQNLTGPSSISIELRAIYIEAQCF